ncbi:MAG: ParA family protein [Hyphomicrobiaceae bacterium]
MAEFLAVANRKGGVGKSTISVMLTHAFAVWGGKRVLLLDLDSQCNASLILQGGEGWVSARKAHKTIADYFLDTFDESAGAPRDYLVHNVGDVRDSNGRKPVISLLPGSLMLEDAQGELYIKEARQAKDPDIVGSRVRGRLERMIRRFEGNYDVVILDCAPGLSFAALAALKTADLVLVPFRPDYVSQLAVDRVALLIEGRRTGADLAELPLDARRYACVANSMRGTGREQNIFDEIALDHPMLNAHLPQSAAIADAFDYRDDPRSIEEKYGDATPDVRAMYEEVASRLTLRLAA